MALKSHEPVLQPSNTARRLLILGFALVILLLAMWFARHALLILYVSSVFAIVLKPAVDWVHRRSILGWRPGNGAALLLLIGALTLAFVLLGIFAVPRLASDLGDFLSGLPQKLQELQAKLRRVPALRNVDFTRFSSHLFSATGTGVRAAANFGGAIMDVLTTLLLIAYFILDGERLLTSALSMVPAAPRARLQHTLTRAAVRMRGWLAGQAMLMLILAASSGLCFGILGVPYYYLLAVFAGVANIIPLLGPLATVIIASLLAATVSGWKVLGVLAFYAVYQQVENAFLTPNIMKSQVQLSAATVLIALLVAGELAGIAGALVAVPSAVLVAELANEYLKSEDPT
jgi:predicted PurR-regulated permease PerM